MLLIYVKKNKEISDLEVRDEKRKAKKKKIISDLYDIKTLTSDETQNLF